MEFYCQPCDKTLKSQVLYDKHCQCKMHLRGGKVTYHCEKCDYTTTHKSKFNLHLKSIKCKGQSETEKKDKDTIKYNQYNNKLIDIEKKYIENPNCINTEIELNKTKKTVKKYKRKISETIVLDNNEPVVFATFADFLENEKINLENEKINNIPDLLTIPELKIPELKLNNIETEYQSAEETFNEKDIENVIDEMFNLKIPELKLNNSETEYHPIINIELELDNIIDDFFDSNIIDSNIIDSEQQYNIQKNNAMILNKQLTIEHINNMTNNIYYINNFKSNFKKEINNIPDYISMIKKVENETNTYYPTSESDSDSDSEPKPEPEPEPKPEPKPKAKKNKDDETGFNIFTMPERKSKKKNIKKIKEQIKEPINETIITEQIYSLEELENSCEELYLNGISYYIDNNNIVYTNDDNITNRFGSYINGEIIKDKK